MIKSAETHVKCILTFIIHLELDDDSLIEVESSALDMRCGVAKLNGSKVAEKLSDFLRGDNGSILTLNEEETLVAVSLAVCMTGQIPGLTMSLGLLSTAWTT